MGATAAIGSLEDVDLLVSTFTGADAVYCMVPPNNYFDLNLDLLAYYRRLGNNYMQAIRQSGVKRVVNLSSIGAHLDKGSGIILGAHDVEQMLNELSSEVAITHLRPTSFYYNLFGYVEMIKVAGSIAANYGADHIIPWVSPIDIAAAIAKEIVLDYLILVRLSSPKPMVVYLIVSISDKVAVRRTAGTSSCAISRACS